MARYRLICIRDLLNRQGVPDTVPPEFSRAPGWVRELVMERLRQFEPPFMDNNGGSTGNGDISVVTSRDYKSDTVIV